MTERIQTSERPGLSVPSYENSVLEAVLRWQGRGVTGEAGAGPGAVAYLDHFSDPRTTSYWNGLVVTPQGDRRHVVHAWSMLSSAAHQWEEDGDGVESGRAEYLVYDDGDARVVTVTQEEADGGPTVDDIRGTYNRLVDYYVHFRPEPSAVGESVDVRRTLEALPDDRLRSLGHQMLAGTLTPPAS